MTSWCNSTSKTIKYLNITDLCQIDIEHLQNSSHSNSLGVNIHNLNSLKYLIEIVQDNDCFPNLYEKAAIYGFNIITRHIFVDGNKRTGMTATLWFLALNCVCLKPLSDEEIIEAALSIATNEIGLDKFVGLLREWETGEKNLGSRNKSLYDILIQYDNAWAKLAQL